MPDQHPVLPAFDQQLRAAAQAAIDGGETLYGLSTRSGVQYVTLARFVAEGSDVRLPNVVRLTNALGLELAPDPKAPPQKIKKPRKPRKKYPKLQSDATPQIDEQLRAAALASIARGESYYGLSRRARVEHVTLMRLLEGTGDIKLSTVTLLAKALGLTLMPKAKARRMAKKAAPKRKKSK
jgi:DNA-binding phage protein